MAAFGIFQRVNPAGRVDDQNGSAWKIEKIFCARFLQKDGHPNLAK